MRRRRRIRIRKEGWLPFSESGEQRNWCGSELILIVLAYVSASPPANRIAEIEEIWRLWELEIKAARNKFHVEAGTSALGSNQRTEISMGSENRHEEEFCSSASKRYNVGLMNEDIEKFAHWASSQAYLLPFPFQTVLFYAHVNDVPYRARDARTCQAYIIQ